MTTKLVNDNTEAFYRISQLYYQLGEEEDSLRYMCRIMCNYLLFTFTICTVYIIIFFACREIRECLRLDPDHKTCFPFYKVSSKLVNNNTIHMLINITTAWIVDIPL